MRFLILTICVGLAACSGRSSGDTPAVDSGALPMRWDHRPEAAEWTEVTMRSLSTHGAALPALVPSDIATFCPAYPQASEKERRAFWAGLLSALAKHESTWNPDAVGGGGRWFGLVQIAPATAKWRGCAATSGRALKDGASNLACGVRIAAAAVPAKGSIAQGMRDWGPFHSVQKRSEMAAWTRAQPYCAL